MGFLSCITKKEGGEKGWNLNVHDKKAAEEQFVDHPEALQTPGQGIVAPQYFHCIIPGREYPHLIMVLAAQNYSKLSSEV